MIFYMNNKIERGKLNETKKNDICWVTNYCKLGGDGGLW